MLRLPIARQNSDAQDQLIAVAAAVIATGFGVWASAPTSARVIPSVSQGIEPFQLMMNAKGLPTAEAYDHGFVFH
jgi:hypothetical protein